MDYDCWMCLTPYMNPTPYSIAEDASVLRAYRLFRTMGFRYLCVVDKINSIVGMVTRQDLVEEHLESCKDKGHALRDVGPR
jgi:chloride channel 7